MIHGGHHHQRRRRASTPTGLGCLCVAARLAVLLVLLAVATRRAPRGTRLEARDVRVLNREGYGIWVEITGSGSNGVLVNSGGATVSLSRVAISNSGSDGIHAQYGGKARTTPRPAVPSSASERRRDVYRS